MVKFTNCRDMRWMSSSISVMVKLTAKETMRIHPDRLNTLQDPHLICNVSRTEANMTRYCVGLEIGQSRGDKVNDRSNDLRKATLGRKLCIKARRSDEPRRRTSRIYLIWVVRLLIDQSI